MVMFRLSTPHEMDFQGGDTLAIIFKNIFYMCKVCRPCFHYSTFIESGTLVIIFQISVICTDSVVYISIILAIRKTNRKHKNENHVQRKTIEIRLPDYLSTSVSDRYLPEKMI